MRVIVRPASTGYSVPTELQFKQGNQAAIVKFLVPTRGTTFFATDKLLKLLLLKVQIEEGSASLPSGTTQAQLNTACNAIEKRLPNIYTNAAVPLIAAWGNHCNYCGTPMLGLAEVEHTVPKKNYPTYALSWENFLLSCGPCNTQKSAKPDRATVRGWIGTPNPTPAEYYSEIRENRYMWPDLDSGAFFDMQPKLQYLETTNSKWVDIPTAQAFSIDNTLISQSVITREVVGRISNGTGGFHDVNVRCAIGSKDSLATQMVSLVGLNKISDPTTTYDRRVFNRTVAWLNATVIIKHFLAARGTPSEPAYLTMLKHLASSIGFFDIWIHLIWQNGDKSTAKSFVETLNTEGFYPGSNISEMFK